MLLIINDYYFQTVGQDIQNVLMLSRTLVITDYVTASDLFVIIIIMILPLVSIKLRFKYSIITVVGALIQC